MAELDPADPALGRVGAVESLLDRLGGVLDFLKDAEDAPLDATRLRPVLNVYITLLFMIRNEFEVLSRQMGTEFWTPVNSILQGSSMNSEELLFILNPQDQNKLKKWMMWEFKKPKIEKIIVRFEKDVANLSLLFSLRHIYLNKPLGDTSNLSDALQKGDDASYQAISDALEHAEPDCFRTLAISNALKKLDFRPLDHYALTLTLEKVDRTVSKLADTDQF